MKTRAIARKVSMSERWQKFAYKENYPHQITGKGFLVGILLIFGWIPALFLVFAILAKLKRLIFG